MDDDFLAKYAKVASGFSFDKGTAGTSTVIVGGTTNTNLLIGTSTYGGGLNSAFGLGGIVGAGVTAAMIARGSAS